MRLLDLAVGAQIDRGVPENARWKHRNGDEARVAFGAQDGVGRQRHFRAVELGVIEHAPERFARAQRQKGEIDAFDRHAAVDQRLRAVIAAAGNREFQIVGHGAFTEGERASLEGCRPRALGPYGCRSKNNTRIADALIAVDQVDLLGLDFPAAGFAHDAVAGPAGEHARLVAPEFADQKIGAQHAHVVAGGGEDFDIG